jgi:vanillate O-demethylase monooxygenase subunit
MSEVQVQVETTEQTVHVTCIGPTQRVAWPYRKFLGIRPSFHFYDEWTTYFSPVYSVYDHWWVDPATGKSCRFRWRAYVFFTPRDESNTGLTTFVYASSDYAGLVSNNPLVRWLLLREANYEIGQDIRVIQGLADQSTDLEGAKLSRFDKALIVNRQHINRIYRGLNSDMTKVAPELPNADRQRLPLATTSAPARCSAGMLTNA